MLIDADGDDGREADRLDGQRRAARGALRQAAAALRLLQAALRAGHEPAGRRHPRRDHHGARDRRRAGGQPARARRRTRAGSSRSPRRCCATRSSRRSAALDGGQARTGSRRSRCPSSSAAKDGAAGLRKALEDLRCKASRAPSPTGYEHHRSSPTAGTTPRTRPSRRSSRSRRCTTTSSARARGRSIGLVLETGEPREVHHFALLIGYGASRDQPVPRLRDASTTMMPLGAASPGADAEAEKKYVKAVDKGDPQGDVQDGHLDHPELPRRPDLRGRRPEPGLHRRVLHVDARRGSAASGSTSIAKEARLRHERAFPPKRPIVNDQPRRGRPVPVPRERRAPPLQPGDDPQAPVRLPVEELQRCSRSTRRSSTTRRRSLNTLRGLWTSSRRPKPVPLDEVEPVERS